MTKIKPVSIQPKIPNIFSLKWQAIGVVLALMLIVLENKYAY